MKIFLFLLFLFPIASFAQDEAQHNLKESACVSGRINFLQYNSDNTISINIDGYALYTDRVLSYPLIFEAFARKMNVLIYTASCHDGGGFSKIMFYLPSTVSKM